MTNPAAGDDWTRNIPSAQGIHNEPQRSFVPTAPSQDALGAMRDQLINMVLETITMAVQGFVNFGEDLFEQVAAWAADVFGKATDAFTGLGTLIQRLLTDPIGVIGELPQMLIEGLEDALTDVGNWIDLIVDSILGVFGIGPGGDLLSRVQAMAGGFDGMLNDLDDQIANFGDLLSNLLTSPQSVLGFLPQSLITGLGDLAKFIFGGHVSGTNLVIDPSFANATQWAGSQGAQSVEQKHSGTTSWKITTDGSAKYVFFNGDYRGLSASSEEMLWKASPGDRFDFEIWIYGPTSNVYGIGTAPRLRVACHDSTGVNAISYVTVTSVSWSQLQTASGTWYRMGGYMTVPANRDRIRPYIEFSSNEMTNNNWYIDDVLIREVTEAQNIVERVFGGIGSLAATILDAIIPGLNATKITSGQFAQSMINGLDQFVKFVFGGTSSGSNMVGDSGFEDPAEWPGIPGVMSTVQKRSGTNSRLLTSDGASVQSIWFNRDNRNISSSSEAGMFKVQPGDKYYVECWVYAPSGNTFAGTVPDIRVRYQNSTTGANSSPGLVAPTWAQYQAAANSWYKLSGYAVVPAGYDRMAPYFSVRADTAGNLWFVDDLMVREVTESQNIVQRIFGGVGATITTILDAIIPGLSAGKITSGQFGQQMIAGLETLGRFIFGGQSAGSNLVGDSGFENDEQWPSSRIPGVQSTEQKRSGSKSRKVTHSGSNNYVYLNSDHRALAATDPEGAWKVQPGEKYYYEGWIYIPSTNTNTGTTPRIVGAFLDSKGVLPTSATQAVGSASWSSLTTNAWNQISGYVVVPANYDRMIVRASTNADNPSGNVYYWDDVIVREVTESQNIVQRVFGGIGSTVATILDSIIPGMNASKIISGQFAQDMIAGLGAALGNIWTEFSRILTGLLTNPVEFIGNLLASMIPGLPASKITSGQFAQDMIANLGTALDTLTGGLASKLSIAIFGGKVMSGSNLVVDTEFDTDLWNVSGMMSGSVISTEQKRSGTKSIKVTGPSRSIYMIGSQDGRKDLQVAPGEKFFADSWFYLPVANAATAGSFRIDAIVSDSTGTNALQAISLGSLANSAANEGSWKQLSAVTPAKGYFTVPDGYDRLNFRVTTHSTVPAGDVVFIDDFIVREVTESQNIVEKIFGSVGSTVATILDAIIPGLNATKIVSGQFGQNMIVNLISDLGAKLSTAIFGGYIRGGANLATDPEMARPELWTGSHPTGTWEVSTEQSQGGTTSIKTTAAQAAGLTFDLIRSMSGTSDVLFVSDDQKLYVEFWARKHASVTATKTSSMYILATDSKGVNTQVNVQAASGTSKTITSTGWTKVSSYFTIPAGYDRARVIVTTNTNAIGDVMYFDTPMINEVTESQNIVQRIFGGVGSTVATILDTIIPGLNASKIISGQFGQGMIVNLISDLGAKLSTAVFGGQVIGGTNLASDPDMSIPELWAGAPDVSVVTNVNSYSGATALEVRTASNGGFASAPLIRTPTGAPTTLVVQAGQKYRLKMQARPYSDNTATRQVRAQIEYTDSKGVNAAIFSSGPLTTLTNAVWTLLTWDTEVPAGYDRANFRFITINTGSIAGDKYLVDVPDIREITETQNILQRIFGGVSSGIATILDTIVPGLNASKIISGQFGQGMIAGLDQFVKFVFGGRSVGPNFVSDPGFEDAAEWPSAAGSGAMSTEQMHGGTTSRKFIVTNSNQTLFLHIDNRNLNSSNLDGMWKTAAGKKYLIEAWVFAPGANTFGTGTPPRIITGRGDTTGALALSDATVLTTTWAQFTTGAGAWWKMSGYYTIPAGYDRVRFALRVYGDDTTGNVYYFDDVSVEEVTEAQNIVQRIFGGVGSTVATILDTIVPGLNASKIISGQFAQDMIAGLGTALGNIWTEFTRILTGLLTNPVDFIGNLLASMIPGLPTGKITSGQFAQTMINGLQDAFITVNDWIQDIIDGIESALRKIPIVGGTLANMVDALGDLIDFTDNTDVKATNANTKVDKTTANNMVTDPGFDTNLWIQGGGVTISTAQKRTGAQSLLMTGAGATRTVYLLNLNDSSAGREVPVSPDDKFYMEAWVWRPSGNDATGTLIMGFQWLNAAGTASTTGTTVSFSQSTLTTNAWMKITATITMPSTAVAARPYAQMGSSIAAGNLIYWDDVVVREATASEAAKAAAALVDSKVVNSTASNMVTDPGFENTSLWTTVTGVSLSTVQKRSGSRSLLFTGGLATRTLYLLNGNSNTGTQRITAVSPGDQIVVKAWVFRPTGNSTTGNLTFNCIAIDAAGATTNVQTNFAQSTIPFDTWTEISATLTMPATAVSMRPVMQLGSTVPTGDLIYVDDLYMQNQTLAVNAQTTATSAQNIANQVALDAENLLAGSDFEDANNFPWSVNSPTRTRATDQKRAGSASYKFSGTPSGATYTGPAIAVRAGERLYAEAWVRKDSAYNATDARLRLGNNGTINNNSFNLYFRPSDINTAAAAQGVANTDTWVKVSLVSNPFPADVTRLLPSIVMTSMTAGNLWIDDIVVRRVKESDAIPSLPQGKIDNLTTDLSTIDGKAGAAQTTANDAATAAGAAQTTASNAATVAGAASTAASGAAAAAQSIITDISQGVGLGISTVLENAAALFGLGKSGVDGAAANAAQIAALQATAAGGNNGGKVIVVDFSSIANGAVPSSFTKFYNDGSSDARIQDGKLEFPDPASGNASGRELFAYNADVTLSNYQEISGVMGWEIEHDVIGNTGYNYIIGRLNSTGTQFVIVQFGYNDVRIGYNNGGAAGAITWAKAAVSKSVPGGSIIRLRCGTNVVNGERIYQAVVGNTVVDSWNDTGNLTAVGVNNRRGGLGFQGSSRSVGGQYTPAPITLFSIVDNIPQAIVGQGLQVYRNAGTTGGFNANTDNRFPNGFFDTTEAQTSDITWDSATCLATVNVSDWYHISFSGRINTAIGSTTTDRKIETVLIINGSTKRRQTPIAIPVIESSTDTLKAGFQASFSDNIYLAAGTTVRGGINPGPGGVDVMGNAGGDFAYMTIVRGRQ